MKLVQIKYTQNIIPIAFFKIEFIISFDMPGVKDLFLFSCFFSPYGMIFFCFCSAHLIPQVPL